jgi:ketosteroid isomerase-like protein
VVVVSQHRGSRGDRELASRNIDAYTVRDGRVVEVWSTGFNVYEADAFWG